MMATNAIEKGIDVVAGGAMLNSGPHYMLTGVADMGDSLEVVKKLVYDDKVISMDELLKAVEADFEGYEEIRQMYQNMEIISMRLICLHRKLCRIVQNIVQH